MYKLCYLPIARQDMIETVRYISWELDDPAAAEQLAAELIKAGEGLREFPYAQPVYVPLRPLKHEYRKLLVRNHFMFYWVDEEKKSITIARVIYARREYGSMLE